MNITEIITITLINFIEWKKLINEINSFFLYIYSFIHKF